MRCWKKNPAVTAGQLQMLILAAIAAVLTVASLTYILVVRPPYLRATRYGVPFYSSQVIDPVTQQPVALDTLAYHYKTGQAAAQQPGRPPHGKEMPLSTVVQIAMFFVAFYIMYLAFLGEPFGK